LPIIGSFAPRAKRRSGSLSGHQRVKRTSFV